MSFRRNGKTSKHWQQWRAKHAAALAQCGLPEVLFQDEVAWENFLAEGFLPAGCGVWSGWSIEMLSPEQVRCLHDFLNKECAGHIFQQSRMNQLRKCLQPGSNI